MIIFATYDSLGMLLMKGLADKEMLYNSQPVYSCIGLWHKFKDVLEVNRRLYSGADAWTGFEYLADEMLGMKMNRDSNFIIGGPRYDEEKRALYYQQRQELKT